MLLQTGQKNGEARKRCVATYIWVKDASASEEEKKFINCSII
jgi:hypothetical protein